MMNFLEKKYNIELYVNNEEQEYQYLLKHIEEIKLDEVMMNIKYRVTI